ncbi:MAG: methyl coenzyme M reductase system, component A2 [Euryarchaeota archaeon]|nr:methyl coenzyme M reductase system, component A2 [Euryarchaeota archaeon]MCG2736245.1 methyl coenzyme M reductase system, component A2 [Candidatus Methanoperedenaceae archaeon]
MVALIEIRDLNINVNGKQILKNINLDINECDSIGIIGKSGAGKSTLLHLLRGFEEFEDITGELIFNISYCPKCGKVNTPSSAGKACPKCSIKTELQRVNYLNSKGMHRKIMDRTAIMMQRTFGLYSDETVLENVMRSFEYSDIPKERRPYVAAELIEKVKLSHRMMYTGKELSGGEKQRVVLARQLAKYPMLLLADEPTGTLDPKTAKLVHESILQAKQEHNMTLLVTSHLPGVLHDLTNKAILLDKGEIIRIGKTDEIIEKFSAMTGVVNEGKAVVGEPIIILKDVKKKYYSYYKGMIPAVNGVSFKVNEGEIFGIIGISGAGKTSLSKIIAGILERDSGKVDVRIGDMWVDMIEKGTDFRGRAKPYIGYLHQEYSLYPHRNVFNNLTESIGLKLEPELARTKAINALKAVSFDENTALEVLDKTSYELSVGERQRVTMAQVLIREPRIIIFDEPTGTMDPITKNEVANSILTARKETGTTFVIVSHDMEFVGNVCDRAAYMKLGKITAIGDVGSVLEDIAYEEKPDREKTPEDRNNDMKKYLKRAFENTEQGDLCAAEFYTSKAKEIAAKLNKDISEEFKKLKPAYEKGISEMLKEAERYASEGQIYGMDVYIENALKCAAGAGIDISGVLPKFNPAYAKGLEEALQEAERHEAKGFLGMSYQYIHRAGNYASKLGKNIEDILKSLPWYEKWTLTDIHMKLR